MDKAIKVYEKAVFLVDQKGAEIEALINAYEILKHFIDEQADAVKIADAVQDVEKCIKDIKS